MEANESKKMGRPRESEKLYEPDPNNRLSPERRDELIRQLLEHPRVRVGLTAEVFYGLYEQDDGLSDQWISMLEFSKICSSGTLLPTVIQEGIRGNRREARNEQNEQQRWRRRCHELSRRILRDAQALQDLLSENPLT